MTLELILFGALCAFGGSLGGYFLRERGVFWLALMVMILPVVGLTGGGIPEPERGNVNGSRRR